MRIAVFTPFGALSRESGLLYLLANYLQRMYPDVLQLRCNGLFSLCDRDGERSWKRCFDSCLACGCDQGRLAAWSSVRSSPLSRYLSPRDVDETRRWISALSDQALTAARYREVPLFPLCQASFFNRFGQSMPDNRNKNHLRTARRMLLSAARMLVATERFNKQYAPDVSLVADGSDYLSAVFVQRSKAQGAWPAVFRWDLHKRSTLILHPRSGSLYSCDLLLDNITAVRPDPCTWSEELLGIISEILSFLGLSDVQLALPIAR